MATYAPAAAGGYGLAPELHPREERRPGHRPLPSRVLDPAMRLGGRGEGRGRCVRGAHHRGLASARRISRARDATVSFREAFERYLEPHWIPAPPVTAVTALKSLNIPPSAPVTRSVTAPVTSLAGWTLRAPGAQRCALPLHVAFHHPRPNSATAATVSAAESQSQAIANSLTSRASSRRSVVRSICHHRRHSAECRGCINPSAQSSGCSRITWRSAR